MQIHEYRHRNQSIKIRQSLVGIALLLAVIPGSAAIAQEATKAEPAAVQATPKNDDLEQLRKSVRQLTAEVTRLRAENVKLEKYRQVDYLREQLLKEEQRVEALQKELADMSAKETSLQRRLDEIEPQLRPDRIEQSRAGVGSMRPEEDREAMQKQFSNEKRRIQTQLDQYQANRVRIQSAISTAEASIAVLRQRLREAVRATGIPARN